ncbi:adhesin [Cutibacterium granulosum]|nr:adhesin [Cutibacterium granulosum]
MMMTTKSGDTFDKDYRSTPFTGLIIGTIVGAAWPTVFGILHVRKTLVLAPKEYPPVFIMSLMFPLIGWLTGLWERKMYACDDSKKRRLKTKIIGAAMATFAGMLMFSTRLALVDDDLLLNIKAAIHPLPLAVFPCAGLVLSDIGIRPKNSKTPFILSMSIASVIILFITVAVWFYVFGITELSLSSHS